MALEDIPGISVLFGKAANIFTEDGVDAKALTVVDPAELDEYLTQVASVTGLDKESIEVNGDGQSIRFTGGDIEAFRDYMNLITSIEQDEVGVCEEDDPEGVLGKKGDVVFTLDLPGAAPA